MSILTLPPELILCVLEYLEQQEIVALACTNRLLQSCADLFLYQKDANSNNPKALVWAAKHGQVTTLYKALKAFKVLEVGENVKLFVHDLKGCALDYAARNGHEAMVKLLLDNGADIHGWRLTRAPIHTAAREGHAAIVKLLLDEGADVNAQCFYGSRPLSCAVIRGHEAVVRLLLDNRADPNLSNGSARTPLSIAAEEGYETIVRLLLEKGAVIREQYGKTPLQWAAENGHTAIVKLIVDNDVDTKVVNSASLTD